MGARFHAPPLTAQPLTVEQLDAAAAEWRQRVDALERFDEMRLRRRACRDRPRAGEECKPARVREPLHPALVAGEAAAPLRGAGPPGPPARPGPRPRTRDP